MPDPTQKSAVAPLHGVRVLDLTRVLAGPWASQLLADYGADVIKVERPGSGDDTRQWGPPWLPDGDGEPTDESAYFMAANRNKRSVAVDLADDRGAAIVRQLAADADVLLENFKVGSMERFGLSYPRLRQDNPGLVYCSVTAYSRAGSRAGRPGYDAMIQASAGLMSITGEEDGPPQKVGVAIADIMAGMYAATAIMAALVARNASGKGQQIEVPLYESQVAWLANQGMNYLIGNEVPGRLGSGHPNLVPYQAFPTQNGHLMLAIGNDRQFRSCMDCLGLGEVAVDERFVTNAARVAHRATLVEIMTKAFVRRETLDWLDRLAAKNVPAGPINNIAEVFSDPYARECALVRSLPHRLAGDVPTVANPVRFGETPVEYRLAPPVLGQDTEWVLREYLGLDHPEIDALAADGVVQIGG